MEQVLEIVYAVLALAGIAALLAAVAGFRRLVRGDVADDFRRHAEQADNNERPYNAAENRAKLQQRDAGRVVLSTAIANAWRRIFGRSNWIVAGVGQRHAAVRASLPCPSASSSLFWRDCNLGA